MRFGTFLNTLVGGALPKTRVKLDLINFKQLFKYAEKDDLLYNNLIDNIFWLLEYKFTKFELIYTSTATAYNELCLIVSSQVPQFMFIQKKQLLETLDTFAELHNWGSVTKDNVKRTIVGSDSDTTSSGYIPINASTLDPYSKDNKSSSSTTNETTDVSRNATDFLEFFTRMRWNTATIDLDKILRPYYSLFITMNIPNLSIDDSGGGGGGDVGEIAELKKEIEAVAGVAAQNTSQIVALKTKDTQLDGKIGENRDNINTNSQAIQTITSQLPQKLDKTEAERLYLTQAKGDERYQLKGSTGNFITQSYADNKYLSKVDASNTYTTRSYADSYFATKSNLSTTNSNVSSVSSRVSTIENNYKLKSVVYRGDTHFKWWKTSSGGKEYGYMYCFINNKVSMNNLQFVSATLEFWDVANSWLQDYGNRINLQIYRSGTEKIRLTINEYQSYGTGMEKSTYDAYKANLRVRVVYAPYDMVEY